MVCWLNNIQKRHLGHNQAPQLPEGLILLWHLPVYITIMMLKKIIIVSVQCGSYFNAFMPQNQNICLYCPKFNLLSKTRMSPHLKLDYLFLTSKIKRVFFFLGVSLVVFMKEVCSLLFCVLLAFIVLGRCVWLWQAVT